MLMTRLLLVRQPMKTEETVPATVRERLGGGEALRWQGYSCGIRLRCTRKMKGTTDDKRNGRRQSKKKRIS